MKIIKNMTENDFGMIVGLLSVPAGYTRQLTDFFQWTQPDFISGNLGDFGATLAISSFVNSAYRNMTSFGQIIRSISVPLYWTGFEILQKYHLMPGRYDENDIYAYFLGYAVAACLAKMDN